MSSVEEEEEDAYTELHPGRKVRAEVLGPHRGCRRCAPGRQRRYTVDVLDARIGTELVKSCSIFLVPPQRCEEWLFSSVEGQWQVVADSKAGRLIMVAVDGNDHDNDVAIMKDDVAPLVTPFLPLDCRGSGEIEYLTQENRVKLRRILALIDSTTTGPMLVEDVAVAPKRSNSRKPSKEQLKCYRRLSFRRNPNMIQSEALLVRHGKSRGCCTGKHVKCNSGSQKAKAVPFEDLNIDHSFLTSEYHEGMIAGFVLIANNLEQWLVSKEEIRVMIIGLGAGLLPMFVRNHIPVNDIQVVELDEQVGNIAKNHFGFLEDNKMKLQIGDGVDAVKAIADAAPSTASAPAMRTCSPQGVEPAAHSADCRLHVLIVDTDSKDPSNGSSCPAPECLEDSFLDDARKALLDGGMMVVNVVASARKYHVYSKVQLRKFFPEVYEIEVDEDVNRVLIATKRRRGHELTSNMKELSKLKKICKSFSSWGRGPNLHGFVRSMKRVA